MVTRSLAVDVGAHLGPRPAALRVHPHVAGACRAVVPYAPIATRVPSEDIDTEYPEWSPAASPSMSAPTWVHVPPLSAYTRTWPASRRRRRSHMRLSPRACRPRTSIPRPGVVARSLAVDVGAHLGPRPAALGVHPHVAGESPAASFP